MEYLKNTILAVKQNGRTVWLIVHYLVIWYLINNRLHSYKSSLLILRETWSLTLKTHDLYNWSRFPFCHFVLSLKLLSGDQSQILRGASNKSLKTHKIPIDSQCKDWYAGCCGKFLANDTFLYILICIFDFVHCKSHYSSITLHTRVALNSLFVVSNKSKCRIRVFSSCSLYTPRFLPVV